MKRFVSLVMSVILVFSLAACGSNDTGNTTASQSSETQERSVFRRKAIHRRRACRRHQQLILMRSRIHW